MQYNVENNLQSYFTDMEGPRNTFKTSVNANELPKRLIVFHGVGGVGKSSLLRMFRLYCKNASVPVGLAAGDDAKSIIEVITCWMEDLEKDGVSFPSLRKTQASYRAIQAKVNEQARKGQGRISEIASKAASKTAKTAGGALLGAAVGSIMPGIGTAVGGALGGVVGGMGAEAFTDWLHGFLTKPDIDLLLDPIKRFIADFLDDITGAARKKRLVLLLDTFEQMTALEDSVCDLAHKINPNVLMVIAGRRLPDWGRLWSEWMMDAHVEELKPMTDDAMIELIHRYYATMRGGEPDPQQVSAIISFARGLPMVVTSAVQLWVKYGFEDFQTVKAEIIANLVDRLMEGVPGSMIPALEAAAVARWFDQPILRAVMKQEDVREIYQELRRFPFVRGRMEGFALHDSVREMIDENLRLHDSERHYELHERAAAYFEKRVKRGADDAEKCELEFLYHRIRSDEQSGYALFQGVAERLSLLRLSTQLRILINDVRTYASPDSKVGLLVSFYLAILYRREHLYEEAIQIYQNLSEAPSTDIKLRAYALCCLGEIYTNNRYLEMDAGVERATRYIHQSLAFNLMDSRLVQNYFSLARIAVSLGRLDEAKEYLQKAKSFFEQSLDDYGQLIVLIEQKELGRYGFWQDYLSAHAAGLKHLSNLPRSFVYLRGKILRKWARVWAFTGRYSQGEKYARECLEIEKQLLDNITPAYTMRDLGWLLGFQDRFEEAEHFFHKSIEVTKELGEKFYSDRGRVLGLSGVIMLRAGNFDESYVRLEESLAIHQESSYFPGSINEVHNWLGLWARTKRDWKTASKYYLIHSDDEWQGQMYFRSCAQAGLIRSKYAMGEHDDLDPLIQKCESRAIQYEYNDHLASIRLIQGHLAFGKRNYEQAIAYYKDAMIYALRFNRFLLDELVSGRPYGSPLLSIIPLCHEHGEAGNRILSAIGKWWKEAHNSTGASRLYTISPISEGIPLIEAEKMAREHEQGDGLSQKSVIEQLDSTMIP